MSIRSESPSQVFFILLPWLRALISSGSVASQDLKNIFIAYDNMCNLCRLRVVKKPLPLPSPMDQAWLQVHKIIDTFHMKNHTSTICHTVYNPAEMKEKHPFYNTQAGEQTLGRFKNIVCAMNKTHHLFYIHRMVRRRNTASPVPCAAACRPTRTGVFAHSPAGAQPLHIALQLGQ